MVPLSRIPVAESVDAALTNVVMAFAAGGAPRGACSPLTATALLINLSAGIRAPRAGSAEKASER